MRRFVDLGGALVFATAVAVVLLLLRPVGTTLVLHVYLLVAGALLMLGALAATRAALPQRRRSPFAAALHRGGRADARPGQLERVERAVTLGTAHAFDFHARLRPVLREVAAARLAVARGVDLDSPAGRAALGEEAWELLRADREVPDDRFGPGVPVERLERLVDRLESL